MPNIIPNDIVKTICKLPESDGKLIDAKKIYYYFHTKVDKSRCYKIIGDNVEVGQGCIFVGNQKQVLSSYGFDTCSPFIMITKDNNNKRILGHIDSMTDPEEIVQAVKANFAPKEIENASFYYLRGAETLSPGENLGRFAVSTIEKALSILNVKGSYLGQLKTGFEDILVSSKGLFSKDHLEQMKLN